MVPLLNGIKLGDSFFKGIKLEDLFFKSIKLGDFIAFKAVCSENLS